MSALWSPRLGRGIVLFDFCTCVSVISPSSQCHLLALPVMLLIWDVLWEKGPCGRAVQDPSNAHAQPLKRTGDAALRLKLPLRLFILWANIEWSGVIERMRKLAWAIVVRYVIKSLSYELPHFLFFFCFFFVVVVVFWWPFAGKELSSCLSAFAVLLYAVLIVCVLCLWSWAGYGIQLTIVLRWGFNRQETTWKTRGCLLCILLVRSRSNYFRNKENCTLHARSPSTFSSITTWMI